MATRKDWMSLASETFHALDRENVASLYEVEWRHAGQVLTAQHRDRLNREKSAWKRYLFEVDAVLYGVARRLAPNRRLVFALSLLLALWAVFELLTHDWSSSANLTTLVLLGVFVAMTLLLGLELVDKLRFRGELELARDLQADLVPKQLPAYAGFELAAFNRIANTVGGDVYDFVPLPDGRLAALFADASGHGMTAGLVMAVSHAAFLTQIGVDPSPAAVGVTLNRILCRTGACRTGGPRQYLAAVLVLLSPDGSYSLLIAGHPPVLKLDASGRVVERIGKGAYPIGIKASTTWSVEEGRLEKGQTLLLHSDGLPENRNQRGQEFGDASIERIAASLAGEPAAALTSALANHHLTFLGMQPPEDDVSVAAIRRVA